MAILKYDNEATIKLLAIYTTPDVEAQRSDFINALELQPGQRVLDVGSGPGFLANSISERVGETGSVCGIDISKPLLDVAQSKFGDRNNVEFHLGNANKLPFSSNDFDVVVSTQVLEYVPDVDSALSELNRVLKDRWFYCFT